MRRALGLLAAAGLLACASPERSPGETALFYLDALASDPVRTLELLTPAFHRAHGLRFEEVAERPFADPDARRPTPDGDTALELERARLGWLTVLTKRIFALQRGRFTHRVLSEDVEGNRAEVVVRVEEPGRPPLDAGFRLLRASPREPWRIDAVQLPEPSPGQLVAAFLVAPDAELHRRIAARREPRLP